MRKQIKLATERCNKRTQNRLLKNNPPSIYNKNDIVLIRFKVSKYKVPVRCSVKGKIAKCHHRIGRYKVRFNHPESNTLTTSWFNVNDITSVTTEIEKNRKKVNIHEPNKAKHQNKYYIPFTSSDVRDSFRESGFIVRLDPTPNGNCQFEAIADQLHDYGIYRSAATLRQDIVRDLRINPSILGGTPLSAFVENNDFDHYISQMERDGTYGDHITLQRTADLFNVQIVVVSTLGVRATRVLSQSGQVSDIPTILLGHLEEGNGEHYLSLRGPVNDLLDSVREDEANDTRLHTSYPNANSLPDNIRLPDDTSLPQHTSLPHALK